jgi:ribosomal protein S18 acetylase RimI-like enzyme
LRSAHVARTPDELAEFHRAAPWRVRVGEKGEILVLGAWRQHLSILAIKGLWAAAPRVPAIVADAVSVARAQGFDRVISPLLQVGETGPYRQSGFDEAEDVIAIQGTPFTIVNTCARVKVRPLARFRPASLHDLEAIGAIDSGSFSDLWAYGWAEIADAIGFERVCVAEEGGAVVGYATVALHGSTATLGRLAVQAESRGRGIGRALLGECAAWALKSGGTTVSLCTQKDNVAARALYGSAGLHELREPYAVLLAAV